MTTVDVHRHQHREGTFGMLRRPHAVLGSHRRPRHVPPPPSLILPLRARRDWLTYSRRLRMQARHERWDRAADRVVEAGIAGLVLIVALAGAGVLVIHGGAP